MTYNEFREKLNLSSEERIARVRASTNNKTKPSVDEQETPPEPGFLGSMNHKLDLILAFLTQKVPAAGPAKFTVTERDENGKIKSFHVE